MKTIRTLPLKVILLCSMFILTGCETPEKHSENSKSKNTIVLLSFKTQPDKATEAVSELTELLKKVKHEPHFVSIKLHIDPNDQTNILLYEEWEDVTYYNGAHMETDHIQQFMSNSRNFLAGPPEITFWNVEKVFK
jgi:quinol monooxygenase YgiN